MANSKIFPAEPSVSLGRWIDNLFNTTLADVVGADFTISSPSVNIVEHNDRYDLELAAPGLEKKDFSIKIENDFLVVSAEKKQESSEEDPKGKFTRREFNYSSFKRSFRLDDTIRRDAIAASYEHGVLKLTLPKKEEVKQKESSSTIEIK